MWIQNNHNQGFLMKIDNRIKIAIDALEIIADKDSDILEYKEFVAQKALDEIMDHFGPPCYMCGGLTELIEDDGTLAKYECEMGHRTLVNNDGVNR